MAKKEPSSLVDLKSFLLDDRDPFGEMLNLEVAKMELSDRKAWYNLLRHTSKAATGRPTKSFISKASDHVAIIGKEQFLDRLKNWLTFLTGMDITFQNQWYSYFLESSNTPVVKGLVWVLSTLETEELDDILENLLTRCFQTIPGMGPRSAATGNACIYTIASRKSLPSVALLNRVRSKIKQRSARKLIDKYISETATALEISVADLEDFSIPDFDLREGEKSYVFNDYIARISIESMGKVKTEWIKPDNTFQKSVPAFVKKEFADELKALRSDVKLIPKTMTVQRDRMDRMYIQKRKLNWGHFEKYCLNHGLMSFLTRRLIWVFEKKDKRINAIWWKGQWQDSQGNLLENPEMYTVSLWHPLYSDTEGVLAWRAFLQKHEIIQPLKQAYREVYILTEAEINTGVYSNRMAAHLLKQHQFNALAVLRGWKYQMLGAYDDGRDDEIASIKIPDYNLRAEFWINEVYDENAINETGIHLYVSTDQVRFSKNEEAINLREVPEIIFSEIMRDVDLFVGVASVGNDPEWRDNSGMPRYRDYWQSYSFGNLTEVAKIRKDVLEKLLPRLKISKVSKIEGKFLVVEGKKRVYKIHIGSTNILMEPNDQYLCIVPDRNPKGADNLFIPFEGDRGLSIILSKAFLLAADDKIRDSTILSQIN